jgi:hypothetical protein
MTQLFQACQSQMKRSSRLVPFAPMSDSRLNVANRLGFYWPPISRAEQRNQSLLAIDHVCRLPIRIGNG